MINVDQAKQQLDEWTKNVQTLQERLEQTRQSLIQAEIERNEVVLKAQLGDGAATKANASLQRQWEAAKKQEVDLEAALRLAQAKQQEAKEKFALAQRDAAQNDYWRLVSERRRAAQAVDQALQALAKSIEAYYAVEEAQQQAATAAGTGMNVRVGQRLVSLVVSGWLQSLTRGIDWATGATEAYRKNLADLDPFAKDSRREE